MRWGFKNISEYFIGDILQKEDDLLERSKIKTVFWFCSLVSFFLVAYIPIFLILPIFTLVFAFVTIVLLGVNLYLLCANKPYKHLIKFIFSLLVSFDLITFIMIVPVSPAGYLLWAIFLILVTNFILGKNWAIGFSGFTILALFITSIFAHFGIQPISLLGINTSDISSLRLSSILKLGAPIVFIILTLVEFVTIGTKTNTELNQNLTLQRELTKKIHRNESKYRRLVEGVGDIVIELDAKGKFTFANQAFIKISGFTSEELIGKSFRTFINDKEELKDHIKGLEEQIRNRITMVYSQYKIHTKSGEEMWIGQNRSIFYDGQGKVLSSTCVARDITTQKRTNDHLKEAKIAAEKASMAKAQFLSSMSHEIRTPLNAIIGTINLIDEENLCIRTKSHFETLKFSADNLLKLVSDILDLNKLQDQKLIIKKEDFNLKSTTAYIKSGLQSLADKKGLDLIVNLDDSLPEIVNGDPLRLTQILNNLVHNGLKFTEKGGVEITILKHHQTEQEVQIYFSVNDTGIGISQESIASIFEAFAQDNDETIRNGSGLGLAISKNLLYQMGSEIDVESAVGEGSNFSFLLSFDLPNQLKSAGQEGITIEPKKLDNTLKGVHILVVEDNLINQKVSLAFLTKWGATTKVANNGKEATEIVQIEKFDLILMDLQMPVMNGVDATKAIRNLGNEYTTLPIIALTASAVLEVRQNAMEAGLDDFVTKPFKPENLNQVIKKHLDLRKSHQT